MAFSLYSIFCEYELFAWLNKTFILQDRLCKGVPKRRISLEMASKIKKQAKNYMMPRKI